jgi:SPOR domain
VARGQESTSAKVAAPSLNPPPIALPSGSAAPITELIADKASVLPRFAPVNLPNRQMEDAGAGIPGPPPKMYFEVGKFKQESWARKATDELAQLGLPTSVAQKGRLWGNSYYVLVGPYSDRDTAALAHKTLASSGFKPRPFERGSRSFTLSSGVVLNRTRMVGDFVIRWESYVPEAKVKFLQDDLLVTSADARWVERETKNERNAFVYQRNPDGSHTLLEIRFAGMSKVLVFSSPS